jgi:hypothetical protein
MTIWRENCASRFEANKAAVNGRVATVSVASEKNTLSPETFSDFETQQKVKKPCIMEEIELNFDASCQQIIGLESETEICSFDYP